VNRNDARKIAEVITNEQLYEMFNRAKTETTDWTVVSTCNKGFTKGVAWNILAEDFDVNTNYHVMGITNMVREFGEFLPDELNPKKKPNPKQKPPVHHDPKFFNQTPKQ